MAHLVDKDLVQRANTAVLLSILWGALAACAIGAMIYDIAYWEAARWRAIPLSRSRKTACTLRLMTCAHEPLAPRDGAAPFQIWLTNW